MRAISILAWADVETGYWAYPAARDYAEQYDPHDGTGLIPQSLPMLKGIFEFWCHYYKVNLAAKSTKASGDKDTE